MFSQDIEEYQEMEEEHDSDDNSTMDMVRLFFIVVKNENVGCGHLDIFL